MTTATHAPRSLDERIEQAQVRATVSTRPLVG
jgi:hypothetical protein